MASCPKCGAKKLRKRRCKRCGPLALPPNREEPMSNQEQVLRVEAASNDLDASRLRRMTAEEGLAEARERRGEEPTLRDILATQAPPVDKNWATWRHNHERGPYLGSPRQPGFLDVIHLEAEWRYDWADRMLAYRDKNRVLPPDPNPHPNPLPMGGEKGTFETARGTKVEVVDTVLRIQRKDASEPSLYDFSDIGMSWVSVEPYYDEEGNFGARWLVRVGFAREHASGKRDITCGRYRSALEAGALAMNITIAAERGAAE